MKDNDPKKLLLTLHQNLQILEERKAKQADNALLSLLNQIDDYKEAIALTELVLKGKLSFEDLVEELKPLTLDLNGDGTTITFEGDEIIYGDKITVGDVTGSAVAVGEGSAAADRGAIAISGNVGGNLVISIGNTNIPIPRFMQIAVLITALGVIFLVAAQGPTIYQAFFTSIKMPIGSFNVAIAEFQVNSQSDQDIEEAEELTHLLANAIGESGVELEEVTGTVMVCPPPSGQTQLCPPDIGVIEGETEEIRATKAATLAHQINANVIIYGTIDITGPKPTIKPEFYLAEENHALTFLADEIISNHGQYPMGKPIEIHQINLDTAKRDANKILVRRFQVLVLVAHALNYFSLENHQVAEDYLTRAITEALKTDETVKIRAWEKPDLIYQMLGNVALMQPDLEKAKTYYKKALADNPKYARAQAGLGSVYYAQALGVQDSSQNDRESIEQLDVETRQKLDQAFLEQVDLRLLDQAIAAYQQALAPDMEQPPLADVSARVNYGLGRAYFLKARAEHATGNDEASGQDLLLAFEKFDLVVQAHGDGANPRLDEIAAYAHGNLGIIYQLYRQFEHAIVEYQTALRLLPADLKRTQNEIYLYKEVYLKDSCSRLEPSPTVSSEVSSLCLNMEKDASLETK